MGILSISPSVSWLGVFEKAMNGGALIARVLRVTQGWVPKARSAPPRPSEFGEGKVMLRGSSREMLKTPFWGPALWESLSEFWRQHIPGATAVFRLSGRPLQGDGGTLKSRPPRRHCWSWRRHPSLSSQPGGCSKKGQWRAYPKARWDWLILIRGRNHWEVLLHQPKGNGVGNLCTRSP